MASNDRPGGDDWLFDPSLANINRRLQREFREEAEEQEAESAEYELRTRTVAQLALEARNRGDSITVALRQKSFTGPVLYAAGDVITVGGEGFEVDINIAAIAFFRVVARGRRRGAGGAAPVGPGTFEMRLLERQSARAVVEVGQAVKDDILTGRLTAVGADHLVLLDDQKEEIVIPSSNITFVIHRKYVR